VATPLLHTKPENLWTVVQGRSQPNTARGAKQISGGAKYSHRF